MFQARRKDNNEVISADELKVLENVKELDFVCVDPSCAIDLIPCSFEEHNKKRPFFKKYKNMEHAKACSYGKYLNYLEVGMKRALTITELEDMDYPSQLVQSLPKAKEVDTITKEELPEETGEKTRKVSTGEFAEVSASFKKVTAIDQIVDFYLSCPYNRGVDLNLLGKVDPYRYQFRRIYGENENQYIDGRMFYGILNLREMGSVVRNEENIRIKLHECQGWERDPHSLFGNNRQVNPYWVEIDIINMSKHKISRILKTRESVANESKGTWLKSKKNDGKDAYVFFIGNKPSEDEPYVFKATNGFITFRYTEILKTKEKVA